MSAPPRPSRPTIASRVNIVATLNTHPAVGNRFLSGISGRVLVPEYNAHCTQLSEPPARPLAAQAAIPAWIVDQVDQSSRQARRYQCQHDDRDSVSREGVCFEFNSVVVGALLALKHLHMPLPTARHSVPLGPTQRLRVHGQLWMVFSTGSVVRGAAFPGLNHIQLQARSIVALEALATQTDAPVFTMAVAEDAWTVFYLPDRVADAAVRADRHTGIGHAALMEVLIDLLVAIA